MADDVNRVLKIFVFYLCFQFISTSSRKIATDDSNNKIWSDVKAEKEELHHSDRSRRAVPAKAVLLPRPQVPTIAPTAATAATEAPNVEASNVCLPNPCKNGGICGANSKGEYLCACTLGYRGKFCQSAMMDCYQIGCRLIKDCLSSPNGAVCMCKVKGMSRLCQMSIHSPSAWDKVRLIVSEETIHTGEIIVGVMFGILAIFALFFGIHCYRVNARRVIVRKRYKDLLDQGIVPSELPPDWCEISNDLLKKLVCCKRGKTVTDAYKPNKSQSAIKKKEDELIQLLNSHAALLDDNPSKSRQFYTQGDPLATSSRHSLFQTRNDNAQPVNRRSSRDQGTGAYNVGSSIRRVTHKQPSVEDIGLTSGNSVRSIVDHINNTFNNHALRDRRYSSHKKVRKQRSEHSQYANQEEEDPIKSLSHFSKSLSQQKNSLLDNENKRVEDDSNDFDSFVAGSSSKYRNIKPLSHFSKSLSQQKNSLQDDENKRVEDDSNDFDSFFAGSSSKYRNNSARYRLKSDKLRKKRAKCIKHGRQEPEIKNCREQKYKVHRRIGDNIDSQEKLKKSMSNRRTGRNNEAFFKSLQDSKSTLLSKELEDSVIDITNTTNRYNSDSNSEEGSDSSQKMLVMINEESVISDYSKSQHPYSSRNGNENANCGRLSNSSTDYSRLYLDSLTNYQQEIRNPTHNSSTYKKELEEKLINDNDNTDGEFKELTFSEDPMFYGHLIDPSMKHDNLETTHWYWDHDPGMYDADKDRKSRHKLKTANKKLNTRISGLESNLDFGETPSSPFGKIQSDFDKKRESCSTETADIDKTKEVLSKKAEKLIGQQPETFRRWMNIDKNGLDTKKTYQQSWDINKSVDIDRSIDILYLRSFNKDGEKRYFVSNEIDYEYQTHPDNYEEHSMTTTMLSDMPTECSSLLHSSSQNGDKVTSYMDNSPSAGVGMPSTPVGTPSTPIAPENITVISESLKDGDTLVNVENNSSETDVEL